MDDDTLTAQLALDLDGAFEALVLAHQDRLYSIALRVLGDPRDAEEVAQDAFVRAYRAIESYDAGRVRALRLRAWLAAIVVNLARNRATRRRPPPAVPLDGGDPGDANAPVAALVSTDPRSQPADAVERREGAMHWATLLSALPERYRVPVVLRHVDGLAFAEIADALGRPEGTVKAQVHRGLGMLRAAHRAASPTFLTTAGAERREMTA